MREGKIKFVRCDNPEADETMLHFMALMAHWERKQITERPKDALAAAKARGVRLGNYQRISAAKQRATAERTEAVRPAIAKTATFRRVRLPTSRTGATTGGGKWHAMQVLRMRDRPGPIPTGGLKSSA
jgi:DNA invertase Pin-like site-specific DNA recombinase